MRQSRVRPSWITHGPKPLTLAVKIVKSSLTMAIDEEFVGVSVAEIAEGELLVAPS